ncbi:hypothetical protein IIA15_02045 [candidate division TA06 bacterium]|nr:hypothetical protein [candidate division TA06 bacterium]
MAFPVYIPVLLISTGTSLLSAPQFEINSTSQSGNNSASKNEARSVLKNVSYSASQIGNYSASQIFGSFEILHIPRRTATEGEAITIEVAVTRPLQVRKGELRWRPESAGGFQGIPMVREGEYFVGKIPLKQSKVYEGESQGDPVGSSGKRIEYYIQMVSTSGKIVTLPEVNPALFPFEIEIFPSWLEILTPLPGERIREDIPEIAGLFSPPARSEEISVYLDGQLIEFEIIRTHGPEIGDPVLNQVRDHSEPGFGEGAAGFLILPQEPLQPGTHTVTVVKEGVGRRSWSFDILSSPQTVLGGPGRGNVHGSLSPALQYGSQTGQGGNLPYPEGTFFLLDGYGVGFVQDVSFYGWLSRDPTYGDPFRFGGEVSKGGVTFGFGDLYPSFSEFTLSGLSPRGIETRFSYGVWGFDLVALRTQRAESLFVPYDQYLLGARATLRPFENSSIQLLKKLTITTAVLSGWEDSTSQVSLSAVPEENQLYALGFQIDLTEQFRIRGEFARSHHDRDRNISPVVDEAYEVEASFRGLPVGISLQYEEIGGDYFSFGSPHLETGRKGPSLHLDWVAPQLSMRGGYGHFLSDGEMEPAWNRADGKVQFTLRDHSQSYASGGFDTDLYLLLNWIDKRPLYDSKSITGGLTLRVPPFTFRGSHTEVWTNFTAETRTQMESGGVEWRSLNDQLSTLFEYQANRSRSSDALLNQVRNMPSVRIEYRPTPRDQFELRGNWIDLRDEVIPSFNYNQQVIRFIYTRRF